MFSTLLMAVMVAGAAPATPAVDPQAEPDDRQVLANALKYLNGAGAQIEKDATCLNCHHAPLRNWALGEAARVGVAVDVKALGEANSSQVEELVESKDELPDKQWAHTLASFFVMGATDADDRAEIGPERKDLLQIILSAQTKDGMWKAAGQFANQRRPQRDGDQAQTMWSILALSRYPLDESAAAARDRAVQWLASVAPGATIDTRALRALVESRLGKRERAEQLLTELQKSQHEDGGWGWQPDDPSEAWPVGLALYALAELRDQPQSATIAKAKAFLAKTQREDGSWQVEGKLTKNSQMASYFGTAWAMIGLGRTLRGGPEARP